MEFDPIVVEVAVVVALDLGPAPGDHFEKIETFSTKTFQSMKTTRKQVINLNTIFIRTQNSNRFFSISHTKTTSSARNFVANNHRKVFFLYVNANLTYATTIYIGVMTVCLHAFCGSRHTMESCCRHTERTLNSYDSLFMNWMCGHLNVD